MSQRPRMAGGTPILSRRQDGNAEYASCNNGLRRIQVQDRPDRFYFDEAHYGYHGFLPTIAKTYQTMLVGAAMGLQVGVELGRKDLICMPDLLTVSKSSPPNSPGETRHIRARCSLLPGNSSHQPAQKSTMAGPNLEVFKFGVYVFFPVAMMIYYGDPDWYHRHVTSYKDKIFPPDEKTVRNLPTDHASLREELAKIRARKLEKKMEREKEEAASP
ncbi:hypothetical protein NLI96_g11893 [Meripilus lineatus]|uniref:Uncharacterized protein n=1 Tax=Meripilus lineatus TaxID=2056292 RepID=A0AAD5YAF4_9APHY|nr:hypothetical protein NLI96_g11893 [Physisporinus lineatus]